MQINNEYILLEKIDNHLFKAVINDLTKTTIRFTDLDTTRPAIRLLLNVFKDKYEVIESLDENVSDLDSNNNFFDVEVTEELEKVTPYIPTPTESEFNLLYKKAKEQPFNFQPLTISCVNTNIADDNRVSINKPDNTILFQGYQPTNKLDISNPPIQKSITKPSTNNWCILVDEYNLEIVTEWTGLLTDAVIGRYYGISLSGKKCYSTYQEGWQNTFSELITTEQFVKYIVTKKTEVIVDENLKDNLKEYVFNNTSVAANNPRNDNSNVKINNNSNKEVWKKS